MPQMIKFEQWKQIRHQDAMIPEEVDAQINADTSEEMAKLIAKLDDLQAQRRKLMKDSHKLEAQLLDIDIQLTRNDIEKIELEEKRGKLKQAIEISKKTRKEGRVPNEDEADKEIEMEAPIEKKPKKDEQTEKNPKV